MPGPLDRFATRREFLALLGAAGVSLAAAACTGPGPSPIPSATGAPSEAPNSVQALARGARSLSMFTPYTDPGLIATGSATLSFALTTTSGGVLSGGSPKVYAATSPTAASTGPFESTWYEFTGYAKTGDTSPRTPFTGAYAVEVALPTPGTWFLAAVAEGSGGGVGVAALPVAASGVVDPIGSKARPTATPVATSVRGREEICTRRPVCDLHAISLADAVRSGRPAVVAFATPLLCESRLCGPVLDEVILAKEAVGRSANFVHVEEFLPGADRKPPAPTEQNQSHGFKAWRLLTEPWVFVIDGAGVIRRRYLGSVFAPQLMADLRGLR